MYWYTIGQTLTQQERAPAPEQPAVVLLTSEELSHQPALPGLERTLHHTPPARDARVCKAEVRSDCLAGTLVLPRQGKDGRPLACGYLVTAKRVVLVDDEGALPWSSPQSSARRKPRRGHGALPAGQTET